MRLIRRFHASVFLWAAKALGPGVEGMAFLSYGSPVTKQVV